MNNNFLRKGDVVGFLYPSDNNAEKLRLVYVENLDRDHVNGHDFTAGGYRSFRVEKIRDPQLYGTVNSLDDVSVSSYDERDLLRDHLGVCPVTPKVHNNVRTALAYTLNKKDPTSKWDGMNGDRWYKISLKNTRADKVADAAVKFLEALCG